MKLAIKPLSNAISRVTSTTGAALIGLKLEKKVLRISADNAGRALQVKMPYAEDGSWEFTIDKSVLDGVFKGRAELDVKVEDGTRIWFSAKTFRADFATQPYGSSPELERKDAMEISDAQQMMIDKSLEFATLSPIHEQDTQFIVQFNKDHCLAACFDGLHFAFVEGPGIKGSLEFALPTSTFAVIASAAEKSQYSLSTTSAAICAWNKDFELILPFIQQDVQQTIEDVKGLADSFGRGAALIDRRAFIDAMTAACVVAEDGSAVKLVLKKGQACISASSNTGNIEERIECKVKIECTMLLDPQVTMNILHNVPNGPIEIGVHEERFFFVRAREDEYKATYGGMLSSGDE